MTSTATRRLAIPLAAIALAWWYTIAQAAMPAMRMDAPGDLSSLTAMGGVMMIAMMLPAVLPWIAAAGWRFAAGYGLVWAVFGAAAAVLQSRLGSVPHVVEVAVVAAAVLYEITPAKSFFLRSCTQGMELVTGRTAFAVGLLQGSLCVGCCWLLMAAFFALGGANVWLMIAFTAFVTVQRVWARRGVGRFAPRSG